MRAVLDQGLSPQAADLLRAAGWKDVVHVAEIGLASARDDEILDWAREHRSICVTLDQDFHRELAYARATGPSVILLRAEGLRAAEVAKMVAQVWTEYKESVESGAAVSVSRFSVRVRALPLG